MTESTHEHVETVIASKARRDWVNVLLIVVVLALLGWIAWDNQKSSTRADVATSNAQTLAEQIQQACLAGDVIVGSKNVCARADAVADQPNVPVQGAQGDPGVPGEAGRPPTTSEIAASVASYCAVGNNCVGPVGARGDTGEPGQSIRGDTGEASTVPGPPGADSTVPGPAGPAGPAGAPGATGATGPAGADSTAPGPTGPVGTAGRGLATLDCVSDGAGSTYWVVTYTDGTTSPVTGPCRIPTIP